MRRPAPVLFVLAAATAFAQEPPAEPAAEPKWTVLFDGKTLDNWTETDFGGGAPVAIEDGALVLPFGNNLTGVTLAGDAAKNLPKTNYVLELKAKRVSGSDFFCGLTLPVPTRGEGGAGGPKPSHATVILGGWGGGLVGMSSLDGFDASKNETTTFRRFETGAWYALRVAVTDDSVVATLDGEPLFTADIADKVVGMRSETNLSRPLGLATYVTTGAIRDVRVRPLTPEEIVKANAAVPRIETRGAGDARPADLPG